MHHATPFHHSCANFLFCESLMGCLVAGLLAVFVAITLALTGTNNPGLSG